MNICWVAGAQPSFMKIAPIMRLFEQASDGFEFFIVYDYEMREVFFERIAALGLQLPRDMQLLSTQGNRDMLHQMQDAAADESVIDGAALDFLRHGGKRGRQPQLWGGYAAECFVAMLREIPFTNTEH